MPSSRVALVLFVILAAVAALTALAAGQAGQHQPAEPAKPVAAGEAPRPAPAAAVARTVNGVRVVEPSERGKVLAIGDDTLVLKSSTGKIWWVRLVSDTPLHKKGRVLRVEQGQVLLRNRDGKVFTVTLSPAPAAPAQPPADPKATRVEIGLNGWLDPMTYSRYPVTSTVYIRVNVNWSSTGKDIIVAIVDLTAGSGHGHTLQGGHGTIAVTADPTHDYEILIINPNGDTGIEYRGTAPLHVT